jgi:cobalt-zinc-cadmium efflux system outer membrane protein
MFRRFHRSILGAIGAILAAQASLALGQQLNLGALTLARAEQLLQTRNREVLAARRALEAAQADTISAGARPNPTLSLGLAAINPAAGVGSGSLRDKTVDSSVRIDQVIEGGNRRELRVATAESLQTASAEDLFEISRQQRLTLRSAYYDLLFSQDKVGIARDTMTLFESSLTAAQLRLKAGDIAGADVARLRVDALRAENDERAAEADRHRAQFALAYLVGADKQAADIRAVDPWPPFSSDGAPESVTEEMIERRPDVRAAKNRVEAARKARELAKSLRSRDVTVAAQYDHYPIGTGANTFGSGNSYGLFVSVPLFSRYYYEGEIRRAEVDYNTAEEALNRIRAQAFGDLSRALSDLKATSERLRRYDESLLVEARKAAESAEFAYKNGAIGVMDLLDSRRTLRAIQIDAAGARNAYAKALAVWQLGAGASGDGSANGTSSSG